MCLCSFFNTFFEFGFLDFCLDSAEFFKCMTWQSIFLFVILFIHFFSLFEWSTLGNVACRDDLPTWSIFSHTRIVLKRFVFWFKRLFTSFVQRKGYDSEVFYLCQQGTGLWFKGLLIPFLLAREGYGSEGSREMGHFRLKCPKASIKVISKYHDFGTYTFGHWRGLAGLKL